MYKKTPVKALLIYIILGIPLLFISCMDDDRWYEINGIDLNRDSLANQYINSQRGLFVINEGNYVYDNASLSYYMIDSMKVLNDVFYRANGFPLGDVAQSMVIRDSTGYVVLNNSGKIVSLNIRDFILKESITGFTSPRFILFTNDSTAWVSDLYEPALSIFNPLSGKKTTTVSVRNDNPDFIQHSTEMMVRIGDKLYVSCWSYDEMILVVDLNTRELIDSVKVRKQPNSMVVDKHGQLWVLSDGGFAGTPIGEDFPALTRIDPLTLSKEEIVIFSKDASPSNLCINAGGDTLYFLNHHVYRKSVDDNSDPGLFVSSPHEQQLYGGYYALGVDPLTSEVYVGDALNNTKRGVIYRFKPDASPVDTFAAGILPGSFCFTPVSLPNF